MKRGLIASGVAAVLAAAGLGLGLAASAGAATVLPAAGTHTAAQPAVPRYVLVNCGNKAQVRPGGYVLACALLTCRAAPGRTGPGRTGPGPRSVRG
jgi:hypothetical protein